ncbi:MAG TPA: HesB/YadR/YfhF family protein [Bacilli bacterium]|nr:HesB/YadR/YfhF family protein [Bacilli bacterium]
MMKIEATDRALKWFKEDYGVQADEYVKFFPQIYGTSPVQKNFALAFLKVDQPIGTGTVIEKEGVHFLVEDDDLWFFDGHDLSIDYLEDQDEVTFDYHKK